jgi:hypothetical protein
LSEESKEATEVQSPLYSAPISMEPKERASRKPEIFV